MTEAMCLNPTRSTPWVSVGRKGREKVGAFR
ncbi:hypothetical protein KL86PLE_40887 [uncultured Pleomorphomonas sp.]|uniref:Uncharacterized protein n=1 Tax=uncultured Pleomorphomonas sp. TaxID=442121 RepID=A0A212LHP4_9HYPH|nr:hypothetical protein KL86PLE_40887 [uncultured Pleomorphomonas sp.]